MCDDSAYISDVKEPIMHCNKRWKDTAKQLIALSERQTFFLARLHAREGREYIRESIVYREITPDLHHFFKCFWRENVP